MSRDNPVVVHVGQSRKKLKTQLIQFLIRVPPPAPLEWESFRLHVVTTYAGFYPEYVLNEVYACLQKALKERKIPTITIDSDSEQEEQKPTVCEEQKSKKEGHVDQPQENAQSQGATVLTDEEWTSLRGERVVKKYEYYLKEIYSLIKDIRDTTSCSVCTKLKARITKFTLHLSKDSKVIKCKVAEKFKTNVEKEAEPKCDSAAGERSQSKDKKNRRSSEPKMEMSNLTEDEVEKMRMDLLLEKMIEISMPDILKAAEAVEVSQRTAAQAEESSVTRSKRPKRKSKKGEKLDTGGVQDTAKEPKKKKRDCKTTSAITPQTSHTPKSTRPTTLESGSQLPGSSENEPSPTHSKSQGKLKPSKRKKKINKEC